MARTYYYNNRISRIKYQKNYRLLNRCNDMTRIKRRYKKKEKFKAHITFKKTIITFL